jgi:hypothetical protein
MQKAPLQKMTLESTQPLEGGALWLRYRVQNQEFEVVERSRGTKGPT